jgi:TRAP-type C4-dicarboxylate transport system substrate-binding protein
MTAEQQEAFQAAADEAMAWSAAEHRKQEDELAEFFRGEGLEIYTPDVEAFRAYAQEKYLNSPLSADWPEGMIDRINAL